MQRHGSFRPILEAAIPFVLIFVVGVYAGLSEVRAATTAPTPPEAATPSCSEDALGTRYCAPQPTGTAVLDTLGRVLCAPGRCVLVDDAWHCAVAPAGAAYVGRDGEPECDGGCEPPEHGYCKEP
jgi:hypothetical protein